MNLLVNRLPFSAYRFLIILFLFVFCSISIIYFSSSIRADIHSYFESQLFQNDYLPNDLDADIIYVLGGSQNSLGQRFVCAASLYKNGFSKKIIILSRSGITDYNYNDVLGRNLTNDEWAIKLLVGLGVPPNNIELRSMQEGFFGTFTESKNISELAINRDYKNIILVTSPDHTRRSFLSFKNELTNQDLNIYVQASKGNSSLFILLKEFLKLKFYQYFLLHRF